MAQTIDSLEIQIQANSSQASRNLEALAEALTKVKTAASGGLRLTTVANQLTKVNNALNGLKIDNSRITGLIAALSRLQSVQKASGLNSVVNTLRKIPAVMEQLDNTDLNKFEKQINQVTRAIRPLAVEMEKISRGFAAFPTRLQAIVKSNMGLNASNVAANKSLGLLGGGITGVLGKLAIWGVATQTVAEGISGWITESNNYIENLNLFVVAMGEYAEEAQAFAEQVGSIMGIDPSEWMRNQGVFQTLLTGFGVGAEKAALMSKNLTQLGYDLSSFFNISFEDSMQKLQSGISGELEPLRRLGYDLSEARLKAIAMANGIDIAVASMTQAQKAQLRYYAILTQVTTAQGDMARTLQAPANQLRILQAAVTQAARALGNIFIPALNAVLPYAIAFVNIIRWVATEIANLFGFSLPEVDYSGVTEIADAGNNAEESLGGAAGAAKELKGALLGIDELNIIEPNQATGGSGGGGASIGVGDDLGLDLPEYDFLGNAIENRANEIFSSLKKSLSGFVDFLKSALSTIADVVKALLPSLMGIGTALGLVKLMKFIQRLRGAMLALESAPGILGAVTLGLKGFAAGIKGGLGPLDSIHYGWLEFQKSMQGLKPFTKATITVAGLGAEFVAVYKSVKDLALGTTDLGTALLNIVPTMTIVGVLLTSMFKKWGLLATLVGGAVAAILGFNAAQAEMREALVEATLFDGQGVAIEDLADNYRLLIEAADNAYEPLLEMNSQVSQNKQTIMDLSSEVDTLMNGISTGVLSAEENLPRLTEAFNQLYESSVSVLEDQRDMILYALAGTVGEALTEAGHDLKEYYALVNGTTTDMINDWNAYNDGFTQVMADLDNGLINGEEAQRQYFALMEQYNPVIAATNDELAALKAVTATAFADIDYGDAEQVSQAMEQVGEATTTAKENIDTAAQGIITSLESMRTYLDGKGEDSSWVDDVIAAVLGDSAEQKAKIDEQIQALTSDISTNLVTETDKQVDAALEAWDGLSFFEKMLAGFDSSKWIQEHLDTYKSTQIDPVVEAIEGAVGDSLGEDGAWADEAFSDMMASLFPKGKVSSSHVTGFTGDVQEVLEETLPKYVEPAGETIPDDLKAGIESNTQPITDAATTISGVFSSGITDTLPGAMQTAGIDTIAGLTGGIDSKYDTVVTSIGNIANDAVVGTYTDALGVHSPSTVMTTAGENTIQGLIDGITNKQNAVSSAMGTMLNALLSKMETFTNRCRSALNELLSDFASAMRSVSVSTSGSVSYSRLGTRYIPRFASGGFPLSGQLFVARESGPELVGNIGSRTAVANNEQIVESVTWGVETANEGVITTLVSIAQQIIEAIQQTGGEVTLDGEKVGEMVTKWQNRQTRVYNRNLQTI